MSRLYLIFFFLKGASTADDALSHANKYPHKLAFFKKIDIFLVKLYQYTSAALYRSNYRSKRKKNIISFCLGYRFLLKHMYFWVVPLAIVSLFLYFSLFIRSITLFKLVLEWFLVLNVFYWLISGFVYFIKKYKFNRFTSAIQRFWRRSFIIFWLIESSLFIIFIYLLFNASQEPAFAFDFIQLNKSRLYSWKFFVFKSFFVFLIIIISYMLLVSLKWNVFSKHSNFLIAVTVVLTYIVWLEFYQFFYVINWYGEIVWIFDADDKIWYAESIFKRARILNHYVTICVIAKFWHIIYIYIFWVFFVLRSVEQKKISYIMLSANLQNFIILYIMNWLLMYPWVKFIFRKFLTYNHKSFKEFREFATSSFYNDFVIFYKNALHSEITVKFFKKTNFFYKNNFNVGVHTFSKDFVKPQINELFLFINTVVFCILYLLLLWYLFIYILCVSSFNILYLYRIFLFLR